MNLSARGHPPEEWTLPELKAPRVPPTAPSLSAQPSQASEPEPSAPGAEQVSYSPGTPYGRSIQPVWQNPGYSVYSRSVFRVPAPDGAVNRDGDCRTSAGMAVRL